VVMRANQWDYRPFIEECAADDAACDAAWGKYCHGRACWTSITSHPSAQQLAVTAVRGQPRV
jgi:hypothetical protein